MIHTQRRYRDRFGGMFNLFLPLVDEARQSTSGQDPDEALRSSREVSPVT